MIKIIFISTVFSVLGFAFKAAAYPEYAVRYNIMRCTACHVNPTGGGPRNINGKLFSAHGFKINPFLVQDYVSADFRGIYYYPQRPTPANGGAGIMSGSIAGYVPVDADNRIHLVIDENVAGFSQAPTRSAYALFSLAPQDNKNHWFEDLMVGRIRPAFGITTDEHRTYTHVQTGTQWYEFETGAQLSGTPGDHVHYDLALVNGTNNMGTGFAQGEAEQFGEFFNIRYMPTWVMLGASAQYREPTAGIQSREAYSLYSVASVGRATSDRVPIDVRFEYDFARNWDSNLANGFVNDPTYVTQMGAARSQGAMLWVDYNINQRLMLIYKFDWLRPDMDFSDIYERNGFGFRWFIGPGVNIQVRTEFARATNASEVNSIGEGGQDATFAILQIEI